MNYIEISATIFGILQGYLVMVNKRSNWIAYIIQMILMLIFSLNAHLYGDSLNSLIYIFVGVSGYIIWTKKEETGITRCSIKEKEIYIISMILLTFLTYLVLVKTNDPLPLIDSFTSVSSFIATYYMMVKKIDTWVIWLINDIFYCITYWFLPKQALYLFALNIIWAFMAIASYINWQKIMHKERSKK